MSNRHVHVTAVLASRMLSLASEIYPWVQPLAPPLVVFSSATPCHRGVTVTVVVHNAIIFCYIFQISMLGSNKNQYLGSLTNGVHVY
jgi:hypothetical protein